MAAVREAGNQRMMRMRFDLILMARDMCIDSHLNPPQIPEAEAEAPTSKTSSRGTSLI